MPVRYVQRHDPFSRVCHWVLAGAFLLLVATGLGLYDRNFLPLLTLLGGEGATQVHRYAGVVFFVTSLCLSLLHLKDSLSFDSDDAKWLSVMGGYLSKRGPEPPMGKFNTGQKLFDLCSLVCTLGFGITGTILWSPAAHSLDAVRTALMVHSLLFVVMTSLLVVHVYLGTVGNPGTLPGMLYGEVTEAWAKKHASKWLAKVKGGR